MRITSVLRFISSHPLNSGRKLAALRRFVGWQVGSRLVPGPVVVPFVNGTRLLAAPGWTVATGNLYTGLLEMNEMSFVGHLLRPGDLFVDVGANLGAYTVLAASIEGVRCISFEPDPESFARMVDNIRLNGMTDRVRTVESAVAENRGSVSFAGGSDALSHILGDSTSETRQRATTVRSISLDEALDNEAPTALKIDVEGYETAVIHGATRTLRTARLLAVVMETNGSGARYGFDEAALHGEMIRSGFTPSAYEPRERRLTPHSGVSESGTTIYVRNVAEAEHRLAHALPLAVAERGDV